MTHGIDRFSENAGRRGAGNGSAPLVVIPPYRRRSAQDGGCNLNRPVMVAEVGRKALALRGWRRWLARAAGLPIAARPR